uniref:secretory calcium-binding phosphoprotein 1 isoform X2 n=1 Tax=Solea senegalensis TaxID=28829 RepID=UPI001CD8E46D|nr:secretory calcium-binding phosphoprotein 1 isoform X2 [Solea senegalensis]
MEITIITFCLIGAVFANPISYNFLLESSDIDANSTESLSISQSSENNTSEIQSSEENSSNQSSESSESLESTSEDKTSEESKSQSDEDDGIDSVDETRDDSMGSEENVRKSWVQAFAGVTNYLSAEDNSSTEVKGQTEHLTDKQSTHKKAFKQRMILPLEESTSDSSDTTSESAEITVATAAPSDSSESSSSEVTGATAAPSDSKDSTSSESSESSETSDSSDTSKSTEDSDISDSAEVEQITTKDCVNGTQSCESEEYVFQDIGDDGHHALDNLMVPDDDERELSLRR